ncbi:MAG: protein tyrosine phosphatase [Rhodobacteraceae bacterium]|nr:protein tyrosine phosphatase [Paracoccaceae bacterium]
MTSVLFVCLGNICRSPLAEGILRHRLVGAGLERRVLVDSAGTGNWHAGKAPDPRSVEIAARNGIDLSDLRARQVGAADFERFDLILAMDRDNLATLERLGSRSGLARRGDVRRFLQRDVPDPYYGGPEGFQTVFDMLDEGCDRLLRDLTQGV